MVFQARELEPIYVFECLSPFISDLSVFLFQDEEVIFLDVATICCLVSSLV